MKQLIISDYNCETNFTYVIIDDGKEIKRGLQAKTLKKYGLYDEEWLMFDRFAIDFDENKALQEFDMIILCEDGCIDIYRKREEEDD